MKRLLRKVLFIFLVYAAGQWVVTPRLKAQASSLHDSLRNALLLLQDSSINETLKQAINGAMVFYTNDPASDSLAEKLLIVDSLIVNSPQLNQPAILSLAEMITRLLQELPQRFESSYYTLALDNLAYLHYANGRYGKALPLYMQSLAIRGKTLGYEHSDYAGSLSNVALVHNNMGQYDKALPLYRQALNIYKKSLGELHPHYATTLNNLALLYRNTGQYDNALSLYRQALHIYKKINGEEHLSFAISLTNQAYLHLSMGQYDKALPLFQQALTVFKKTLGEEHPYNVSCSNGMASLYQSLGQYDKALLLYEQTIRLYKKALGEEHPNYAAASGNLAGLYREMGQYDKSLSWQQQAIRIYKKALGEEHPFYAESLNRLGTLYYRMKQFDNALPLYQQCLAIRKKILGEEHADYAGSLHNLARLYQQMKQYDNALPLYQQALVVYKKALGEEHPFNVNSLNGLAALYIVLGRYQEAIPLFMQAADIELRYLSGSYAGLSEHEKLVLLNKESSRFFHLPSMLFTTGVRDSSVLQQLYANELTLKGMVLEDQQIVLNSIRKSKDSAVLQLYEQWRTDKAFIGKQLLLPLKRRVVYMDSLQEAANRLEQQLSRRSQAFSIQMQNHTLRAKDVGQKLGKDEAAIEFIRFPLYNNNQTDSVLYAALILRSHDSVPHFVALCEEKQLIDLLRTFSLQQQYVSRLGRAADRNAAAGVSHSLYKLVWQPLESNLQGVSTVYYAPAGLLNRIAFQSLQVDSALLLIDRFRLHQLLSTRSVALPAIVSAHPAMAALWGNIRYEKAKKIMEIPKERSRGGTEKSLAAFAFYSEDTRAIRGKDWLPLPASRIEIDSLNRLLKKAGVQTITLGNSAASEEAFKALDGHSPQVLHLATHGFFLPVRESRMKDHQPNEGNTFTVQQNPLLRSGLVLAGGNAAWRGEPAVTGTDDGILTSYEIAHLDLSNTDIIVLSACETALGDIQGTEGVIGLQRALKMAGVKQMLLSLWKVPDRETMELMTRFYRNWLSGQSTREALRNAQLNLRHRYKDPFYWAAFVLLE